jgi:hypothetical protein
MKRRWLIGVVVVLAMILIAGIAIVGSNVYRLLYIPMMGGQTKPMIMTIDKSSSASSFADRLFAKHLIPNKRWFIVLIRMQGLSQQLKAGIYELQPGETAQHFLQRVVAGDVMAQSFSIIDGTRQAQVVTKLQSAPYLTNDPDVWPLIAKPYLSAEGLLLADTYFYDAGSHSKDLLMHAHNQLLQYLEVSWQQRSPGLPYKNSYELLIAASILEKETAIAEMQKEVVKAEQSVNIAERNADASVKKQEGESKAVKIAAEADAESISLRAKAESTRITLTGKAESESILAIGQANAESYRLAVDAMGKENFTSYKMTEEIGKSGIKLMPDLLIQGGANGGSSIDGLLGLQILDKMGKSVTPTLEVPVEEVKSEDKTSKKK